MGMLAATVADGGVTLRWTVAADRPRVWDCLTRPDLVRQWLGTVEGEIAAGSRFAVDHGEGYRCDSTVLAAVPGVSLAFGWEFPEEPVSQVRFDLADDGTACRVELRHDDLAELADSYRVGWFTHLTFLEGAARGTPLPSGMFWPLHDSVSRLFDGDAPGGTLTVESEPT